MDEQKQINEMIKQIKWIVGTTSKTFLELYPQNEKYTVIKKVYDIITGKEKPIRSDKNGHIKLFLVAQPSDPTKLMEDYERYLKYYGDAEKLSDIFNMDNERKYAYIEDISLKNIPKAMKNLLTMRKYGIDKCLDSDDKKINDKDKLFYKTLKKIEYYPLDESDKEISKSCQSLRYGELHLDSDNQPCEIKISNEELLPKTIRKEKFSLNDKLPYNERQIVFGPWYLVKEYEKCRNIFISSTMKSSNIRSACNSLVEWSHFLNTLYTLCSTFTKARFIRFILPDKKTQPEWKQPHIDIARENDIMENNLKQQNIKLIAILVINFIEDRRDKRHPSIHKEGDRGLLHLFIFESTSKVEDKLHSYYTNIKITDISGRQTYRDTIFGSNTVTYTEFNQFVCYLKLPVYRNKYHKFILFFDPHNKKYSQNELDDIGIEPIKYFCENVIINVKFYLLRPSENIKDVFVTFSLNPLKITNNIDHFINHYKIKIIGEECFVINKKYLKTYNKYLEVYHYGKYSRFNIEDLEVLNPEVFPTKKYIILVDNIINKDLYDGEIYCDYTNENIYVSYRTLDDNIVKYYNLVPCSTNTQYGGSEPHHSNNSALGNNELKLEWKTKFTDYDEFVASKYYKIFDKKVTYFKSLFDVKEDIRPLAYSFYLNEYEFVDPQSYILRRIQKTDFVETYGNRLYLKKDAIDTNFPVIRITKYIPLSLGGFNFYYEIIYKFDVIINKLNVLEIANAPVFLEACHYYQNKYMDEQSNYTLMFLEKYTNLHESEWKKYLKYLSQFIKMKINIFDTYINSKFFVSDIKYDLICSAMSYYDKSIGPMLMDHLNIPIIFSIMLYALKNLNQHGNFILNLIQLRSKPIADIVLICKKFFGDIILYVPEIQNKFKHSGFVVICLDFKGIPNEEMDILFDMFNEIHSYDPSLVNKFTINDKEMYDIYIKDLPNPKPFDPDADVKYIASFVNEPKQNYKFIKKFNKEQYIIKALHVDKLIERKKLPIEEQNKLIKKENEQKLMSAMLYAKKYDFEYLSYRDEFLNKELEMKIFNDMYGYSEPIIYLFKKHDRIEPSSKLIKIPKLYAELKRKLYMTNFLIDTRNVSEWYKIKKIIRYYSPIKKDDHLTSYIEKNYGTGKISQAWLKMYEMIVDFSLVDRDKNNFKSFHICEAPGNFIAALMYYVKTNTKIKDYKWLAQSLNPFLSKESKKERRTAFGDDYGLIETYPDRWLWGKDNTGDITKADNILFYEKYMKDADLVTSDCGVPNEESSNIMLKVHFAQILMVLNGLQLGKTFLAKLIMPIVEPIQISMLYLLYQSFDKFYFYKGVVNIYSAELYIIGMGYKGIDEQIKKKLFTVLKNFDSKFDLYDNKYPNSFIVQLNYILQKLTDQYIQNFDRQLYYVDNYQIITGDHLLEIKKIIIDKNIEWASKYMNSPT